MNVFDLEVLLTIISTILIHTPTVKLHGVLH